MSLEALIVGGGPTGLIMAAELARYGVKPRLVDKEPQPSDKTKALAVLPRTLEVFEDMGVGDTFRARGRRLRGINVHPDKGKHFYLDFEALDSPFNCILTLQQNKTEDILREHAERLGVVTERPVKCVGYTESPSGILAQLEHADGKIEEVETQWLIACDGAKSDVRGFAGVPFEGYDIENIFVFVDATVHWDLPDDTTHPFFTHDGVVLVIPHPEKNRWRVVIDLPPGEKIEDNLDLDKFQAAVDHRTNIGAKLSNATWMTGFEIRQRLAGTYRKGRVLIAGDAAHCHSPVGGQGMNTGLQDAFNLAWKLGLVIKGEGRMKLLDSYHAERRPIAQKVLDFTNRLTKVAVTRGTVKPKIREKLINSINDYNILQRYGGNLLGGITLEYRASPVVAEDLPTAFDTGLHSLASGGGAAKDWITFRNGPKAGDRSPNAEVQVGGERKGLAFLTYRKEHTLMLFEGAKPRPLGHAGFRPLIENIQKDFADLIKVCVVTTPSTPPTEYEGLDVTVAIDTDGSGHKRYGANIQSLYLIRPDHYVGYRAQPPDVRKLRTYLAGIFYRG